MAARTILIGFPGVASPAVNALLDEGGLPFLKQWGTLGVRAGLRFDPVSSVAAWISMVTGRSPGQHGVFDLFRRQAAHGHQLRVLTSRDLGCEPLWSRLDTAGRRTTILNFPLTLPPPKIDGHVIPGSWVAPRQLRLNCHPADLYGRFATQSGVELEQLASGWPGDDGGAAEWVQAQIHWVERLFCVLRSLIDQEPSDLTLVLVRGFGGVQCCLARNPGLSEICAAYFRTVDTLVAELVGVAEPESQIVLLSEPSPIPATVTFFLNDWLAERGYLTWQNGAPVGWDNRPLDTDQLSRQAKLIDWAKTKAWVALAGGNGVSIVRQDSAHPQGVAPAGYDAFRAQLTAELRAVRGVARVWNREEIHAGPHQELAPDLVLEMAPGVSVSPFAAASSIMPVAGAREGKAEGFFMAGGPALRKATVLPAFSVLDVAPFLLHSMGLCTPGDLEGRVPADIFEPAWLDAHPVRIGTAERPREQPVLDAQAEEEILGRLRALGYIE